MDKPHNAKRGFIHQKGIIKELTTVYDAAGNVLQKFLRPVIVEFSFYDFIEIIIGATILAVPVGLTEETRRISSNIPLLNTILIATISLLFITIFTYYHYYQHSLKHHYIECIKRVVFTYVVSLCVVGIILTLIQQAPWSTDLLVAIKRIIIIALPASMSAAIADTLK
jgi:uncharacterized membrane protein